MPGGDYYAGPYQAEVPRHAPFPSRAEREQWENGMDVPSSPEGGFYNHERTPPMEMIGMVKLPRIIGYSLVGYLMNEREILYAVGCQMGTEAWWVDRLPKILDDMFHPESIQKPVARRAFWTAVDLMKQCVPKKTTDEEEEG